MENDVKERNKKVIQKGLLILLVIIAVLALLFVFIKVHTKKEATKRQAEYRESAGNYVDDFDEENYRKEKERLGLPSSEPVKECGVMNVGGDTFYLGMTMQEVVDFGYDYEEWLDGDQIGYGSMALYLDKDGPIFDMPPMLDCGFELAEGKDGDSYKDYRLSFLHLNQIWGGGWQEYYSGRLSYNAEIVHGIKTDMSYREIMDILEPYEETGQVRIELFGGGGNSLYMRMFEDGTVYVFEFTHMHLQEIHIFMEENLPVVTDKLKWNFSKWFDSFFCNLFILFHI